MSGEPQKLYLVVIDARIAKQTKGLADARILREIRNSILGLSENPARKGSLLVGDLQGFYELDVGDPLNPRRGRYRVIYAIKELSREQVMRSVLDGSLSLPAETDPERLSGIVKVEVVGIRKEGDKADAYALAKKLRDRGEI